MERKSVLAWGWGTEGMDYQRTWGQYRKWYIVVMVHVCVHMSKLIQYYTLKCVSLLRFSSTSTKLFKKRIKTPYPFHSKSTSQMKHCNNNNNHVFYLLSLLWWAFWICLLNQFSMHLMRYMLLLSFKDGQTEVQWPTEVHSIRDCHSRDFDPGLCDSKHHTLYPMMCIFMYILNFLSFTKMG